MSRKIIVAALAVMMLAAGCGGDGGDKPKRPAGKPAVRDIDEPGRPSTLHEVCTGKVRFTLAPPYQGALPHPVMFYRPGTGNSDPKTAYVYMFPRPKNREQEAVLHPESATVQLVGCLDRVSETPAGKECDFDIGAPAPLYTGRYRYTMRAARTGEVLGETTIDSRPDCPGGANVDLYGPKVYSLPREQDYLPLAEPFLYWNGQEPKPSLAK